MTDTEEKIEKPKLDIFELLSKIDSKNITYYDNLDEDVKKTFAPVVVMRWASSAGGMQTLLLNECVNTTVFKFYDHPSLMYKLMVAASDGKKRRHEWIKKKGKDKSKSFSVDTIAKYYNCPKRDARFYVNRLEQDTVLEMAEALGYDSEEIKKIKAEFK